MYQLAGNEFSNLIDRRFTEKIAYRQTNDQLENIFTCSTVNVRDRDFDLLSFKGNFHEDVYVKDLCDTTHVSLHFQLSGSSNAKISGFSDFLPMNNSSFNVINCIDPISNFMFPKQQHYEYLCIGLKPKFFNNVLSELGENYSCILNKSLRKRSFSLFNECRQIDRAQMQALKSLFIPISDDIKPAYLNTKIKEILLLSLNSREKSAPSTLNHTDKEKLYHIKSYIEQHYLTSLTLASISKEGILNEFKLKRGFKELFNNTVFGYIHQLRMQHAHDLLESTDLNVSEVATTVGYFSDSAFVRAFGRYFGISPGTLKK